MNNQPKTCFALCAAALVWLSFSGTVQAQTPRVNPPANPPSAAPNPVPNAVPNNAAPPAARFRLQPAPNGSEEAPPRDPTTVEPNIRDVLEPPEITRNTQSVSLPRLGGRVSLANGSTRAVIGIEEQYWIVEEGDVIRYSLRNQGVETLTIVELSPTVLTVKLKSLEDLFQLK